jgi:high-affinity K+ transport system ATPase subunit B
MAIFYMEYVTWDYDKKGMYIPLGFLLVAFISISLVVVWVIWKQRQFFSPEMRISSYVLLLLYLIIISIDFLLIRIGLGS